MQRKIRKAVIPAAGLGTRFLPATKAQPKEMLPIVDKPTLQYIIEEAVASGIEEILIITGKNKKSIEDHFDKSVELELELEQKGKTDLLEVVRDISKMINIYYIRQKEPRGLGDAIHCARSFIGDEPFAVMLGDDIVDNDVPCLRQLMDAYEEYRTTILGVQMVEKESVEIRELKKLGEKYNLPVIEDLGSGVFIDLSKYGLSYEPTVLDSLKNGADIVTFSGDKMLGGPQAGIIVGKKEYIDKMKKNQLTRALRVDKLTICALEATLRMYLDEEKKRTKKERR